jgi:hypothetical protein
MWSQTRNMRVELFRPLQRPAAFLLTIALFALCGPAGATRAQITERTQPRTTLVVFAEHRMTDGEWTALFDALQKSAQGAAVELPALKGGADLVRGDTIVHGLVVDNPISVYLHGDCRLVPVPRYTALGALGWVRLMHGRIEPFIHVDCEQITQELGAMVLGMSRNRRDTVMGEAMARVIVHEWVHVATQNAGHAKHGVAKSSFGVADLLADDEEIRRDPRFPRGRWD